MTPKEAAAKLDGNEYRHEGSPELFEAMKAAGLVAVFGASDDLMEARGAVYDEFYGDVAFTSKGVVMNKCEEDDCPYFMLEKSAAVAVRMVWDAPDSPAWTYKTTIPHETFNIMEDGEVYCRGIVFDLARLTATP